MFNFFIENKLISSNQPGFKRGDSCINQLLYITHEIYEFPSESLNPSRSFLKCFIIFTSYLILLYFLFLFIPRHFRILVPQ